jgi:hypothetical protein
LLKKQFVEDFLDFEGLREGISLRHPGLDPGSL